MKCGHEIGYPLYNITMYKHIPSSVPIFQYSNFHYKNNNFYHRLFMAFPGVLTPVKGVTGGLFSL